VLRFGPVKSLCRHRKKTEGERAALVRGTGCAWLTKPSRSHCHQRGIPCRRILGLSARQFQQESQDVLYLQTYHDLLVFMLSLVNILALPRVRHCSLSICKRRVTWKTAVNTESGLFVPRTVRPMDISPLGRFVPCVDISPHGQFSP